MVTKTIDLTETIRVTKNYLKARYLVLIGKEGEYYVALSPSLNVSGYGKTKREAERSFNENMETFCEDFMALKPSEREVELKKLGFEKEKLKNKNYSKIYVDQNGLLNGFEEGTLQKKFVEFDTSA